MKKILAVITLLAGLCLNAMAANTGKVTLAWDPSPDPRVNAYRIYDGTNPVSLAAVVDILIVPPATAPVSTITITGLVNGATYTFAVTALDTVDGLESLFSNEVSAPIPLAPLPQVTNLKIVTVTAQ